MTRKIAISLFILVHWFAVVVSLVPTTGFDRSTEPGLAWTPRWVDWAEKKAVDAKHRWVESGANRLTQDYLYFTSTFQRWGMFAPNPPVFFTHIAVREVAGWSNP